MANKGCTTITSLDSPPLIKNLSLLLGGRKATFKLGLGTDKILRSCFVVRSKLYFC